MKAFFYTILIVLFTISCKDRTDNYNPQLPSETQTGAWTFGCKINNIVMIPQNGKINPSVGGGLVQGLTFWKAVDYRAIEAVDALYNRGGIIIKIPNAYNEIGTFNILPIEAGFSVTNDNFLYVQATKNGKLYGSIENTGKITFTRNDDTVISCTFYCKLAEKGNPNNIIEITEGRFDLKK